jgi:hypothetical protein
MRIQIMLVLSFLACDAGQAQVQRPMHMPHIQTIGKGVVSRVSENKDQHGGFMPPWKEVRVTNMFEFKRRPAPGEKVTVIPLDVKISPLDLRILKSEQQENSCGEHSPFWWEIELEPIKLKEFFDIEPISNRRAEAPFDVAIIYPAVKFARQIKKSDLTRGTLPGRVSIKDVRAAIDLTGDRKPDVVIAEFCCRNAESAVGECEYICGKTFMKVKNKWKLIRTSAPC